MYLQNNINVFYFFNIALPFMIFLQFNNYQIKFAYFDFFKSKFLTFSNINF